MALQVKIIYEELTMWRYSLQLIHQNTDKYVACPQYTESASPTLVWDFFAILLRKRFEGLGSLGSGRCGALALAGNCCQTKDEVLSSTSTPSSAISMYYNLTYIGALVGCYCIIVLPSASTPWLKLSIMVPDLVHTSLYISGLVGCIKSISGGWGWMRFGLVRMSTSSLHPKPPYLLNHCMMKCLNFPLVPSLTGIYKHKVLSFIASGIPFQYLQWWHFLEFQAESSERVFWVWI